MEKIGPNRGRNGPYAHFGVDMMVNFFFYGEKLVNFLSSLVFLSVFDKIAQYFTT